MHKAVMDKKWSMFTKWSNEPMKVEDLKKNDESGEGGGKAGGGKAVKAMAATKAKTAAAKAAAAKAVKAKKGSSSGGGGGKAETQGGSPPDDLQANLKEATKVKVVFNKVMQRADQLISQIKQCPSYKDFNNPENLGVLESIKAQVEAEQSEFNREFVLADFKRMRVKYTDGAMKQHLAGFAAQVTYKQVHKKTALILKRHSVTE